MYEHPKEYADFKVASDHYHRYKEDIRLFAEMGLKAYRFSIAWTRIIPGGTGEVNPAGIEHYRDVIRECRKYGIEPIVTMYHFDLPYCLEEKGGWGNRETIDAIAAHNWEVLRCWNFVDVPVFGQYHPLAWSYLKHRDLTPEVAPGDWEALAGANPDFIARNYYSTATIAASRGDSSDVSARAGDQQIMLGEEGVYRAAENPFVSKTKYGWVIDLEGFRYTLRKVFERYHLPILIAENGIGAPDALEDGHVHDDYRIEFIRQHLHAIRLAITDGVEMIGYCPWAALDVVSTHQGYQKRYGFIYVDRDEFDLKEMKRIKKDSFFWYQKIIEESGRSL